MLPAADRISLLLKTVVVGALCFLVPPFLSGILLALAFPKYDLSWLAWVGLVPLLIAIYGKSPAYGYLSLLVFSFTFFTGVCSWIFETKGYTLLQHIIVNLVPAIPLGLFGLLFCFLTRRLGGLLALCAAPFVWVVLEYIRSNLSFLSLPWGLLAHTQYLHPSIIQVSSITGAYGLSFLVFTVNSALAATGLMILFRLKWRKNQPGIKPPSRRGVLQMVLASLILTSLVLLHGHFVLSRPLAGHKFRLSVLQGNIEQDKKWNPKFKRYIMQTYADLSEAASKDKPDLIIWPEAATPKYILTNRPLLKEIISIIKGAETYFLIGSAEYSKAITNKPTRRVRIGNTALLFSPQGEVLGKYLKIRLVPFGEYVPYGNIIPWPDFIAVQGNSSWDLPGQDYTIFALDGERFATVICWESIFPDLFRKFVKNGAGFMINITNEGWFPETAIPYQYLSMNVFRAVENRVFLARAANTGISCFIDPFGRIIGKVQAGKNDTLVRGHLTEEITVTNEKSFYTKYGNIFAYVCFGITLSIIVISFFWPKKF